ncbi:MAG: UDP-N-acetylenolpyruvoylglucosamine reductase (EC [uncultured Thiotrichaceae bacterium]|uniref:UDP-N-acetylenolpyruvoylglucosamine reductase n=1 Tax=uncultured Thiotrichaceae bacterium TaxID=298394 RepID=A0A6S6UEP1_9GAMM|nr:MAG: UDP-N-acetylenolpyruvoylglucosamine reductase (EC [uncultured Thiotrichaceae bacterium]
MKVVENQSLQGLNTFGVVAKTRYLTSLNGLDDLPQYAEWLSANDVPSLVLGGGSNLLFKNDFTGIVAKVDLAEKSLIDSDNDFYYVQAAGGENWHQFVRWTIDQGYAGLENLSLIPGTVGAAPIQNIGAYGVELVDVFESLQAFDLQTGEVREFSKEACQFAYRDSFFKSQAYGRYIILSVTFRLAKKTDWKLNYAGVKDQLEGEPTARAISDCIMAIRQSKLPDPAVIGNAGSFFKNPILDKSAWETLRAQNENLPGWEQPENTMKTSAAWLIDQAGWKGHREGDAGIYKNHALVLVNHANATGADLWGVAQQVIYSVQDKFGIELEPEPRVL